MDLNPADDSARTHDFGRLFWHWIPFVDPRQPLVRFEPTWEMEEPFRASRSLVIRLWPLRRAIAIGWWQDSDVESVEEQYAEARPGLTPENSVEYNTFVIVNDDISVEDWLDLRASTKDLDDYDIRMAAMQGKRFE